MHNTSKFTIKSALLYQVGKISSVIMGFLCLAYWIADFINIVYFAKNPSWLLWYSSAGLLFTAIALISKSKHLITSAFCALFVLESLWAIDFFYVIFFHETFLGFAGYVLSPSFSKKDFYMTLYHIVIPVSLFFAVLRPFHVSKYGWLGASIFASCLAFLTYFLVPPNNRVNCIHVHCDTPFSFLYIIPNPYMILLAVAVLVVFVYLPSNYLLIKLHKT